MKKLPTEIEIKWAGKLLHYTNVPKSQLKPILTLLKDYEDYSLPWRELAKARMRGTESGYMLWVARERTGLSQSQLALLLKMPQGNISQIESGKRPVGKALARKLAKILNLDYQVFL